MSQWRWPGSTGTWFGCERTSPAKSSAVSIGVGCLNTLGLVTTRRMPPSTRSEMPYGSWPASGSWGQPA